MSSSVLVSLPLSASSYRHIGLYRRLSLIATSPFHGLSLAAAVRCPALQRQDSTGIPARSAYHREQQPHHCIRDDDSRRVQHRAPEQAVYAASILSGQQRALRRHPQRKGRHRLQAHRGVWSQWIGHGPIHVLVDTNRLRRHGGLRHEGMGGMDGAPAHVVTEPTPHAASVRRLAQLSALDPTRKPFPKPRAQGSIPVGKLTRVVVTSQD